MCCLTYHSMKFAKISLERKKRSTSRSHKKIDCNPSVWACLSGQRYWPTKRKWWMCTQGKKEVTDATRKRSAVVQGI